jgi:hypothetical protein
MKKLIILFALLLGLNNVWAVDGTDQKLTPDEFRAKQKAFITQQAGLTDDEAAKFFPVYFELQDRKKQINDNAWNLLRKGKDDNTTETQYGEILEKVYDSRIASDRMEKAYFLRFKKILSYKKLYEVQRAEMRFHRELLKGMQQYRKGMDNKR